MRFLFIHQISKLSKLVGTHLLRVGHPALNHAVMGAVPQYRESVGPKLLNQGDHRPTPKTRQHQPQFRASKHPVARSFAQFPTLDASVGIRSGQSRHEVTGFAASAVRISNAARLAWRLAICSGVLTERLRSWLLHCAEQHSCVMRRGANMARHSGFAQGRGGIGGLRLRLLMPAP